MSRLTSGHKHIKNTKQLKIALVLDDSLDKPDGVQQYVLTLGSWLVAQGHDVRYLAGQTNRDDLDNVHSVSKNVRVHFNGNRLSVPLPTTSAKVKAILAAEQFDVIHVQMPHSPFMAAKVVKLAPPSTAIIGTFHIAPYAALDVHATRILGVWLRKNLTLFDDILSVSTAAQQFAKKTFHIETRVVPNAIDLSRFKTSAVQKTQIVFLGRLVPRKGCYELLKAYRLLHQKEAITAPLIICGEGPERAKLVAYCDRHALTDVLFVGFVSEEEKKRYLAQSSVAVFPSTSGESFGIVLLEAMAAGTGVVLAGNNSGYKTVLGSIPESLVDPADTELFAQSLKSIISDKVLAKKLHTRQQELVKQYDIDIVGSKILECYLGTIAKKHILKA